MAHYAFLDENNIVIDVITGVDENSEVPEGYSSWEDFYGQQRGKTCKRTSYNTFNGTHLAGGSAFRGTFAGVGDKYDADNDCFIPESPYPSWTWDQSEYDWQAPVSRPETNPDNYEWSEEAYEADNTQGWVLTPENR